MAWYFTFIDLITYVFIAIMARHLWLRARYFLHMFQLSGYKFGDYSRWLKNNWHKRVITTEHVLFLVILFTLIAFLSDSLTNSASAIIVGIYGVFWFGPTDFYSEGGEKKPLVFTARMIRLMIPFGIIAVFIPLLGTQVAFQRTHLNADVQLLGFSWLLGDMLVPFFIYVGGGLTWPVEKMVHRYYKRQARKKLQKRPDLTVVAITGSYGKTSTKFMIRDLLQERYNVCATPSSYNTPMGICKVINNRLERQHQVLVLEMGARYPGNIKELCKIAPPDVAVVTNVGIAHLETFGSVGEIARTKSEIVQYLKPGGRAVLNGDDERVQAMSELRDDVTFTFTGLKQADVWANDIRYDENGTRFTLHQGENEIEITMALLGKHNVMNMLQAVGVARLFDMRLETIRIAARKVKPVEHRLELKKEGELFVIDDAFNSNPVGARNAVETLSQFDTGRKIIVTPGMIELGEREEQENKEFGKYMGEVGLDLYILVGKERTRPIADGLRESGAEPDSIHLCSSLHEANKIVRAQAKAGDVILYENDLPDTY